MTSSCSKWSPSWASGSLTGVLGAGAQRLHVGGDRPDLVLRHFFRLGRHAHRRPSVPNLVEHDAIGGPGGARGHRQVHLLVERFVAVRTVALAAQAVTLRALVVEEAL